MKCDKKKCNSIWNWAKQMIWQNRKCDQRWNVTAHNVQSKNSSSLVYIHTYIFFLWKQELFFLLLLKTPAHHVKFVTKSMSIVMLASCQNFILTVGIYLNTVLWAAVINQILERISRFSQIGSVKLASNFAPNVHRQPSKPSL